MHNSYLDMKQLIQEQYMHDKLSSQDNLLGKIWYFHTRCHPIDTAEICEDFSSISLMLIAAAVSLAIFAIKSISYFAAERKFTCCYQQSNIAHQNSLLFYSLQ